MEMNSKQDIDAPVEFVYDYLTNFASHQKRAILAGIDAKPNLTGPEVYSWNLDFEWRNKERKMKLMVANLQRPESMNLSGDSSNLLAEVDLKLLELSPKLTRMRVKASINGKTLRARLMVQSARLAKQTIQKRLQNRLAGLGSEIEFDYLQSR